jgi:hypothetical protein
MSDFRPVVNQSFGVVPQNYDYTWFSLFVAQLARKISLLAGPTTIQPQILLQAPDGKVWKVTVDNSGVLQREIVERGSTRPPI